jgi:hypothetical protein
MEINKMTTSKKAVQSTKNPVTISAPKIEKAWSDLVVISTTGEQEAIRAVLNLGKEMKASALSIRDIQKAIKQTGLESPFVKVSHVEGIPTMCAMQKVAGFSALSLAKQLSTAVAAYKLQGAGIGEQMPSVEAIEKANASARKAKNQKATTPKAPKASMSVRDTLTQILAFANALDVESIGESDYDLVLEIAAVLEQKVAVGVDA